MTRKKHIGIPADLGSYSEEAAVLAVGSRYVPGPFRDNRAVTAALASGAIERAILPIENSLAGSVIASYDAILAEPGLHAIGQVVLPIHHCVLGLPGATLDAVRVVESHPIALAQCQEFLARNPSLRTVATRDTGGSAREIAACGDPTRTAIASPRAAARYGLSILAEHVEDRADNTTRFLLLARRAATIGKGHRVRTMLMYATVNEPGALLRTLSPLAERGMNMVRIESRPAGTPWSYRFIVEFEHESGRAGARAAIADILPHVLELRHVGTFAPHVPRPESLARLSERARKSNGTRRSAELADR